MDADKPRRPWWRKNRWRAVGVVWLGIGYILSSGLAQYAVGRDWIAPHPLAYRPLDAIYSLGPSCPIRCAYSDFSDWCLWRGMAVQYRAEGHPVEPDDFAPSAEH